MRQCWMESPSDRPNFTELRVQIEQLLSRDRNYLELDNIDVPLSTSESSSVPKSEEDSDTLSLISNEDTHAQHRVIPLPCARATSKNIAAGLVSNRASGNIVLSNMASGNIEDGAPISPSGSSDSGDYPVTVVSIEKSSTERLIRKRDGSDQ